MNRSPGRHNIQPVPYSLSTDLYTGYVENLAPEILSGSNSAGLSSAAKGPDRQHPARRPGHTAAVKTPLAKKKTRSQLAAGQRGECLEKIRCLQMNTGLTHLYGIGLHIISTLCMHAAHNRRTVQQFAQRCYEAIEITKYLHAITLQN